MVNLKRVWLFGELLTNKKKARWEAFYELLWAMGVGTIPFWLGGFVLLASSKAGASEGDYLSRWWQLSQTTWSKGELLIFAVSLVAPALWLAVNDPESSRPLAHRRPLIGVIGFVAILSAVLYGLIQAQVVVDTRFVITSSLYFSAVAVGALYLALTYHIFRLPDVPTVNEEMLVVDQTDFLTQIQRRGADDGQS